MRMMALLQWCRVALADTGSSCRSACIGLMLWNAIWMCLLQHDVGVCIAEFVTCGVLY